MRLVCRLCRCVGLSLSLFVFLNWSPGFGWDGLSGPPYDCGPFGNPGQFQQLPLAPMPDMTLGQCFAPPKPDYLVKLAYGRTFGTSTELDYATLEISKRVKKISHYDGLRAGLGRGPGCHARFICFLL